MDCSPAAIPPSEPESYSRFPQLYTLPSASPLARVQRAAGRRRHSPCGTDGNSWRPVWEPALWAPHLPIAGPRCGRAEERRVRNAGPRLDARGVPWRHRGSASGGASSVLDPGGRSTLGLSNRVVPAGTGSSRRLQPTGGVARAIALWGCDAKGRCLAGSAWRSLFGCGGPLPRSKAGSPGRRRPGYPVGRTSRNVSFGFRSKQYRIIPGESKRRTVVPS